MLNPFFKPFFPIVESFPSQRENQVETKGTFDFITVTFRNSLQITKLHVVLFRFNFFSHGLNPSLIDQILYRRNVEEPFHISLYDSCV